MFFKLGLGALAALALTTPAMANETAATTQISSAAGAQGAAATGDRESADLFASWKTTDTPASIAPDAPNASVPVPSRMPLPAAYLTNDYAIPPNRGLGARRNP